ncbi:hypothetical protein [Flavobacterium lipolyticum]|uniref:Uncharacterized protein n=1 Tax=Flavobacterium lipolyticum TaxID=2893754 RepID=A0ABS8M3U5_9FLAO|nr:hypothetical protein [Flavobacterium sp. F-126]MCC9018893.1 hypothetical protein [Flavobacterium sp. F-126]
MMNIYICDFLNANNIAQIANLFQTTIKNPMPGIEYPLIFNVGNPQFYFLDFIAVKPTAKTGYEIIGLFTAQEINDNNLLLKKVNELKSKWCESAN